MSGLFETSTPTVVASDMSASDINAEAEAARAAELAAQQSKKGRASTLLTGGITTPADSSIPPSST